jgi:hypothetical protein
MSGTSQTCTADSEKFDDLCSITHTIAGVL